MVILDGDLADLMDRRWEARLFANDGNPGVAAGFFKRQLGTDERQENRSRQPAA